MKRNALTVIFISVLLFLIAATPQFINLVHSNPFIGATWTGEVSPDSQTNPPTIIIISPENNTLHRIENIILSLNVSVGNSSTANSRLIKTVYYEVDWQPDCIYVYERIPETNMPVITEFSTTINLTGIPDGNHTITVNATERGDYLTRVDGCNNHYYKVFEINASSSVSFTIDTTAPEVTVLSPENKAYDALDVQLNFTVNESVSRVSYVLDGQENVTINGNVTLSGLSNGAHSVTVYAQDIAGNVGVSETINFSVEVPFPTTLVIAPIASAAVVGVGLLVYLKRRNKNQPPKVSGSVVSERYLRETFARVRVLLPVRGIICEKQIDNFW